VTADEHYTAAEGLLADAEAVEHIPQLARARVARAHVHALLATARPVPNNVTNLTVASPKGTLL
jgi:hypothetical protein